MPSNVVTFIRKIRTFFQIHSDLDESVHHTSRESIHARFDVIRANRAYKEVVSDIQLRLLEQIEAECESSSSLILELGSGAIPISNHNKVVISSDLRPTGFCEVCIDASAMGVRDKSIDVLIGQNVLHHVHKPIDFLDEARRALGANGRLFLVEPSFSFLAKLIYPNLFDSEVYEYKAKITDLNDSQCDPDRPNQAISYLLFVRYLEQLRSQCPSIKYVRITHLASGVRYLLSGGAKLQSSGAHSSSQMSPLD